MPPLHLMTTCEGPLALNDVGWELCRDFLGSDGVRLFQQIGRYCDYQAQVLNKPEEQPEAPLKLILPFLQARGLTNQQLRDHCRRSLMLVPEVATAYKFLHTQGCPIFAVSRGYRQFAAAVVEELGFDPARVLAGEPDLERQTLSPGEKEALLRLQQELAAAPVLELPPGAASPQDLPPPAREAAALYHRVFSEQIPEMDIGALVREAALLSGPDQVRVLEESLQGTGLTMSDVMFVGHGPGDVPALAAVRAGGGMGISFNGDLPAVRAADACVIADNAWPVALLASVFLLWGREGVMELATKGTAGASRYLVLPEAVIETLMRGLNGRNFNLYSPAARKPEDIARESEAMGARLRGAAIAARKT